MRRASVRAQGLLPQRLLATSVYHLARCRWRGVKNPLIRWFANRFSVDLTEAERDRPESYDSFNDFFTRRLKADARPITGGASTLISPVDGRLTQFGAVRGGELIQAKGLSYRADELLGEPEGRTIGLTSGSYATLYLAPNQYHRVHLPLEGALVRTRYIPGQRFAVNQRTAASRPGLFCGNERAVCWFDTAAGPMALVLVGALNVSSISTRWLGEIKSGPGREWRNTGMPRRPFARGEEIGRFNLGSTVVLVLPQGGLTWRAELTAGQTVRMGEALARVDEMGEVSGPGRVDADGGSPR